ncbi:arabinose isomerase [Edaphobacter modestus]|uniref:L-arabinose isomerase n=1 Tax=Edaphobacter modestus TaxID=388466 RepID=A0A4Q7YZ47_9BACT|nr:arabinose isomerase [Edaphobacter modestus]RZU43090.1 L-arabinose isomerase [Edaphobacter modestus]
MDSRFKRLRIGLVGLGLETYWPQFEGLEERLRGYLAIVRDKLESEERIVITLGLVDSPQKAVEAGHVCRQEDIDILLIYVTTYALSSTILPVILRAKVPVILLNLQPEPAIDYGAINQMASRTAMTSEWLAYCCSCPVPEITNVLRRLDIPFHQVTGVLHKDPVCWEDLEGWLTAARIAKILSHSRMGLMGHYYSGMLDVATDLAQISGRFGTHIEVIEVDQLSRLRRDVPKEEIVAKLEEFRRFFSIDEDCSEEELERAAITAVALDKVVAKNTLNMLAYYYMGSGIEENENTLSSIILATSLLTGNGVTTAGEYEVKNVLAMKILDELGAGGSFTEYYAMDFNDDLVLMGHDGPGHPHIAQDRIRVRPLQVYHGKVGRGLSVEMAVKYGLVTLLSVVEDRNKGFSFLVAEGESVAGPILQIGNTNSRYRFPLGARGFVEAWNAQGPAHHCAIGIGHWGSQLNKIAKLMNFGFHQVC